MAEEIEIRLGLGDIDIDEDGRAIIANEQLTEALAEVKRQAAIAGSETKKIVISAHSW